MDKYIKNIIEETFASKKQQRFFYAKANDKSVSKKERNKWSKWAKEFSNDTDFEKIPEKVETEVDEIVDEKGNIARKKTPVTKSSKGGSRSITDKVVKTGAGSMGIHGVHGTHTSLRYWAEGKELTKNEILEIAMKDTLGFEKTMGQDKDYEEAKDYFEKELGLPDDESEERLEKMGYDENLPEDKIRLVENPKKFIEEFIESVLAKRVKETEFVPKDGEVKEINPIILKQLKSLKNTLDSHNLTIDDIVKHLKKDNE